MNTKLETCSTPEHSKSCISLVAVNTESTYRLILAESAGKRWSNPSTGPEGFRKLRLPDLNTVGRWRLIRLSARRTGRLYPPGDIRGTHFCQRLSRRQGHSAAGRIMSMKNDTIVNRTRYLPACSAGLYWYRLQIISTGPSAWMVYHLKKFWADPFNG